MSQSTDTTREGGAEEGEEQKEEEEEEGEGEAIQVPLQTLPLIPKDIDFATTASST